MEDAEHHNELKVRLEALRFQLTSSAEVEPQNSDVQDMPDRSEYNETLALVHRAGDALTAHAERTRELEAKLQELGQRASTATERLEQQVQDLQQKLANSEDRRASAEDGLGRLCAAIREHFSGPTGATNVESAEVFDEKVSAAAS